MLSSSRNREASRYHGAAKFACTDAHGPEKMQAVVRSRRRAALCDARPAAIRMIESGVLPMDRICTHQLPLTDFQKGLGLVASGKESVKVSLIPA